MAGKVYNLDTFLDKVQAAIRNDTLNTVLALNPATTKHIPLLQPALQELDDKQLDSIVENRHLFDGNWPAFETVVQRYLIYVRDVDPWSLLDSVNLMIGFYESVSIALNNKNYNAHLMTLTYETTHLLIPLTKLVDGKMMQINNRTDDFPRLSYLSTVMLKALNNVRSSPDLDSPSNRYKVHVLIYMSVALCNTYIYIGSPILCNNVFSNINVLKLDRRTIAKAQLIKYRFVLAKFHLLQSQYSLAFSHFEWCFLNLPQTSPTSYLGAVLKYLIPCGMLVGRLIDMKLVQTMVGNDMEGQQLIQLYSQLIPPYKQGNLQEFTSKVQANRAYFKGLGLLVGFLQRIRVIILRNLAKKVYTITGKLQFDSLKTALTLSVVPSKDSQWFYEIGPVDDQFTENVLVSLIDGNFVRAKVTPSHLVILSKKDSFPSIYKTYQVKYVKPSSESWLDK